jgi:alkanesulfonate monooxygenase SsuD/methylene tetrahydromethanopterin reductase-like flavin-dependent oxidoreductase (luciferase family)
VKFGISLPNFGSFGDLALLRDLAREAEERGWDGFFLWDHINWARQPTLDPWIALAAIATATSRICIGTMVTPLARRRPWIVARQAVTLDHLSRGRVILGVGLGFPADTEYAALGEDPDDHVRAEKLDESLTIIDGLWSGEPFSFSGKHYRIEETTFLPRPLQRPRIPIWSPACGRHARRFAARLAGMARFRSGRTSARLRPTTYAASMPISSATGVGPHRGISSSGMGCQTMMRGRAKSWRRTRPPARRGGSKAIRRPMRCGRS